MSILTGARLRRLSLFHDNGPRVKDSSPAVAIAALLCVFALTSCVGGASSGGDATRRAAAELGPKILIAPPRPPELVALSLNDLDDATAATTPERLDALAERNGARRLEGAQVPFFFESEIGRAYLATEQGRAIARGVPAESCPAFGVALGATSEREAAETALRRCLAPRPTKPGGPDCGCQLLASGGVLLAEPDAFAYARATHARLVDAARGLETSLIAEERLPRDGAPIAARLAALSEGARSIWLISPTGPAAAMDLAADGTASLIVLSARSPDAPPSRKFSGHWRAEGYRRGRLAKRVALSDPEGRRIVVLIGYEPDELAERGAELKASADALFDLPTTLSSAD